MANRQRSSVRRWAQLALGAVIVMYGIVGFPTPQDTDPPEAAADTQTGLVYCGHTALCPGNIPHTHQPPPPTHTCNFGPTLPNGSCAGPGTPQYNTYHRIGEECGSQTHGGSCNRLGNLGIDGELLDGDPSAEVGFDEAMQIALEACAVNSPPCNQQAAQDAWDNAERPDDGSVSRIVQAETMCASYGGPAGCSDEAELIDWMCDTGYTTECGSSFEPDAPMEIGQTWSFNERPILDRLNGGPCDDCYIPPGGHRIVATLGPGCDNGGLAVIAAHIDSATSDDGCRPSHCDFGRGADGWCAPPTGTDVPMFYVVGSSADEDAGTMRFRVQLSHSATQTATVTATTRDGTAVEGDDYTAGTHAVAIPAGQWARYVDVPIINDANHENEEKFMVALSAPSTGTTLSPTPEADATIRDDDPAPVLVSISGSPTEEEGDTLTFTVSLDMTPTAALAARWRIDAPHYQGHPLYLEEGPYCGFSPTVDYVEPSNTTLTWSPGASRSQTVSIRTCDDSIDEPDKPLTVELYTVAGAAAIDVGSASGTITDNDDPSPYPTVTDPTFFINSPTVEEGGVLEFTATFMPVGARWWGTLTMTFAGNATLSAAGTECAAAGDDAHIDRNSSSAQDTYTRSRTSGAGFVGGSDVTLRLPTCDDTTPEALETITAALTTNPARSSTAADVGSAGVGTIIDNDPPEVYLAGPVSTTEGSALLFEARLAHVAPADVTVTVSTEADPAAVHPAAAAGTQSDYQPRSGAQVTIPAGSLSQTVRVFTSGDTADEHNETLVLRIDTVTSTIGGTVGTVDTAVGTIVDNDNPPEVSISDASAGETGTMTFNVTLSAVSHKTVTVTASTAASSPISATGISAVCSAVDGSEDYQTRMVLITYPAGATAAAVAVTVCDDTAIEGDETFTVTLSAAANATISATAGAATGVIVDDDTVVCAVWQQLDPVTNTCIARTFFS